MKLISLFFLFISMSAIAQVEIQPSYERLRTYLARDFALEVSSADFVTNELIETHKDYIKIKKNNSLTAETLNIENISGNSLNLELGHAISNLDGYVEQRLGVHLSQAIKSNNINIRVFSGTDTAFDNYLNLKYKTATTIEKMPSLYEEWGIKKYLLNLPKEIPTVIIKIPTTERYAKHYATMIRSINPKQANVVDYDQNSEANERLEMKASADHILQKLRTKYDMVSFGYSGNWIEALKNNKDWKFVAKETAADAKSGLQVEILTIKSLKNLNTKKVLLVSSKKTVWGELASMMITSFLNKDVQSVIFMGSAGAVSDKNDVYDLSVPERFIDQEGRVQTENSLFQMNKKTNLADVNFGATHGNTFSPIEQNKAYLTSIHNLGIDTIDVEQSLLAREISEFNTKNKTQVEFGAVNLVTDKPYSLISEVHSEHDLDRINMSLKKEARLKAVQLLLQNMARKISMNIQCNWLFN